MLARRGGEESLTAGRERKGEGGERMRAREGGKGRGGGADACAGEDCGGGWPIESRAARRRDRLGDAAVGHTFRPLERKC